MLLTKITAEIKNAQVITLLCYYFLQDVTEEELTEKREEKEKTILL